MFIGLLSISMVNADFILIDVENDQAGWDGVTSGLIKDKGWDFNELNDFGIIGFDGPLGSAGNADAGIPAGFLPDNVSINAVPGNEQPTLVGVGPSAGFGNNENAVLANFFAETFSIDFVGGLPKYAVEFKPLTLLGGSVVDIIVTDQFGVETVFGDINIIGSDGGFGHTWGIQAINGQEIVRIQIQDNTGGGAEGISGSFNTWSVPEPASASLLGLMACGIMIRRRR